MMHAVRHPFRATSDRSPMRRSASSWSWIAVACLAILVPSAAVRGGEGGGTGKGAVIHLKNRDFANGELVDSPAGDRLLWKSAVFAAPVEFALAAVRTVRFPVAGKGLQPEGEYCFELAGGDTLFGELVALVADEAVINATGLGQLHVDRTVLRRIYRWARGDLVYSGPNGLDGWKPSGTTDAWREDGGHLVSEEIGAVIRRDFGATAMARFEVELAWNKKADFDLAFGVGDDPKSVLRAFRFDVWDNKIVAWRETEREADVTALAKIETGPGHIHLQALLDQEKGRMLVLSAAGEQLADLKVSTAKPQSFGGLQLTNKGGDIRLERLRIGRWNGETPQSVTTDKARIHRTDGTITYGQLRTYDAANRQFVMQADDGELRLDENQVQDVFLSQDAQVAARSLCVLFVSGTRASGELVKIEQGKVWLKCPGIRETLTAPLETLHALVALESKGEKEATPDAPALAGREGRFEVEGAALLHGYLAESNAPGTLAWQPRASSVGTPVASGISGRIVYRDRPAPPKTAQPGKALAGVRGLVAVRRGEVKAVPPKEAAVKDPILGSALHKTPSVLHLRCGDTIPCTVTNIDEKGVTFQTRVTDATFVRHDQLQALELMPDATSATIAKQKKERLLTLPRMQRDNPPTQLIRSVDGDYLRGRLMAMDDKQLQVEVRLEMRSLPRNRVARIIWLHPEQAADAAPPVDAQPGTRVQALQADNNRLTFFADRLEGTTLSGTSELLGSCRVDVARIDELLLGTAIEQAASTLAFHQWKLTPALDPLASPDGGEGEEGGTEGLESALVGKPAPDVQLDLLDGTKFNLADHKNSVLVLDFWASWCGPCLQVMPQVDKVAREFADKGVKLVAVNLEETPEQVKAALGRLQLDMPVALDRQGRVAERYGATAIPQTVIIGRDGKVARLFVGASARFDEQLRGALTSVLAADAAKSE